MILIYLSLNLAYSFNRTNFYYYKWIPGSVNEVFFTFETYYEDNYRETDKNLTIHLPGGNTEIGFYFGNYFPRTEKFVKMYYKNKDIGAVFEYIDEEVTKDDLIMFDSKNDPYLSKNIDANHYLVDLEFLFGSAGFYFYRKV